MSLNGDIKGDYNFTTIGVDGSSITKAVMTALRPYTTYYIVIQAFNSAGSSPLSSPVSATTLEDSEL